MKYRDLNPDELEALQAFAADYGRGWKEKLSMVYWYNARIYRGRNGKEYPVLHRMRNEFGPEWLHRYKLPKERKLSLDATIWKAKLNIKG